jgi:hypothetical protein
MSKHFFDGFANELSKTSSLLTHVGVLGAKNLLFHTLINTANIPKLKKALGEGGHEFMRVGFKHGLLGKKVSRASPINLPIGATLGPGPMYMYEEGWKYGKNVRDVMKKIPLAKPDAPFKAIALGDDTAQFALKTAPVSGAAAGGTYGYFTGRTKKERYPIKSILAGALTGGLLGKGGKAIGPSAPVVKQLHDIRTKLINPVLSNKPTSISKMLDPIAK